MLQTEEREKLHSYSVVSFLSGSVCYIIRTPEVSVSRSPTQTSFAKITIIFNIPDAMLQ